MAIINLFLENGFFRNHDYYDEEFTSTHFVGGGWDCTIDDKGAITCVCKDIYLIDNDNHQKVERSYMYRINPNGFAKFTVKENDERVKILKKGYVVPKGEKLENGVLGLSCGNPASRYAFFHDGSFRKWLTEHGISKVIHKDPNREYRVLAPDLGREYLLTDGKIEYRDFFTGEVLEQPKSNNPIQYNFCIVSNATWVLKNTEMARDSYQLTLHTLKKPMSLKGIPNFYVMNQKCIKLSRIGYQCYYSLRELNQALMDHFPKLKLNKEILEVKEWVVTNKSSLLPEYLVTNSEDFIRFSSYEMADEAFNLLKDIKFSDPEDCIKYLNEHNFLGFEMTRYIASPELNPEGTKIYVNLVISIMDGRDVPNRVFEKIWEFES